MSTKKIVTVRQLELMTEFMEQHRDFALGRVRSKEGRACSQRLWTQLGEILNSEDVGSVYRSPKEWNKFYNDYKCRIKNKMRRTAQSLHQTGGGPSEAVPLSNLEERLCAILGPDQFKLLPVHHNPVPDHLIENIPSSDTIQIENQNAYVAYEVEFENIPSSDTIQIENQNASVAYEVEFNDTVMTETTANSTMQPSSYINQPFTSQHVHNVQCSSKLRSKRHKESEVEKTRDILKDIQNKKLEIYKAQLQATKERNIIEKEKVVAIRELTTAVIGLHNLEKEKKKSRKRVLSSSDSD